jgi:hypothetical protein
MHMPSAMTSPLVRFGRMLARKRNFLIFALVAVGTPGLIGVTWLYFTHYSSLSVFLWFYMLAVVLVVAFVWGLLMWKFFVKERSERIIGHHSE